MLQSPIENMETRNRIWSWVGLALLAATTVVLLAAPVFPSQDGPVHLYYVDVLRGVLTHSGPYAQHFEMKSYLTPYALEYYSLLALETVVSAPAAEKLLLVFYIFVFGLGFRYLVDSVTERHSPWSLAGIPFCMNALVYLGFLNYCFAVALLLWLCGFWIRYAAELSARRIAALFAGMILMLLTHPVPVAVFLLFGGIYLAVEVAEGAAAWSWMAALQARRKPLFALGAMGAAAAGWVGLFVDRGNGPSEPSFGTTYGWTMGVATEVQLYTVAPFTALRYRAGLMLLLGMAAFALLSGSWKAGRARAAAIALLAVSTICFFLYIAVPARINGSWFFAERFPIIWLLFFLATAASCEIPRRWSALLGAAAVGVTAAALVLQWGVVARIGREIAPSVTEAPVKAGSVGLVIGNFHSMPEGMEFDPYFWCGAQYFRRSQAILSNAPWMDLPILLMRPRHPSEWNYVDPPASVQKLLADMASGGGSSGLDFLLEEREADSDVQRTILNHGWSIAPGGGPFVRIYLPGAPGVTR